MSEPPSADRIPALEARVQADSSVDNRVMLAAAYHGAGRNDQAIALLEQALRTSPRDPAATLWLGLSYEDAERFADARRLYQSYLAVARSSQAADRVRARLPVLERRELQAAVRASLAREQELQATTPPPQSVGVFPFAVISTDTTLGPLGRALAELLTTDLAVSGRLTVLDRAQLQFLLDEIRLSQTQYVDPATAVRAGHLVGAGRIVQGQLAGEQASLALQALVVPATGADTTRAPVRQQGQLRALFDMEKTLALALYREMGIELTVAERERVNQRATQNIQALIAFGLGLEAQDAGRYQLAAQHFQRARQLDSNFTLAETHFQESTFSIEAMGQPTSEIAQVAVAEIRGGGSTAVPEWKRLRDVFAPIDAIVPSPESRDVTAEVLGTEGLARTPMIEIIIRRPAGSE
jgi:tetratricopeptide (TPR) repeat protein